VFGLAKEAVDFLELFWPRCHLCRYSFQAVLSRARAARSSSHIRSAASTVETAATAAFPLAAIVPFCPARAESESPSRWGQSLLVVAVSGPGPPQVCRRRALGARAIPINAAGARPVFRGRLRLNQPRAMPEGCIGWSRLAHEHTGLTRTRFITAATGRHWGTSGGLGGPG
jgi:hypothetical protein